MTTEQAMIQAVTILNRDGIPATYEHPGYISCGGVAYGTNDEETAYTCQMEDDKASDVPFAMDLSCDSDPETIANWVKGASLSDYNKSRAKMHVLSCIAKLNDAESKLSSCGQDSVNVTRFGCETPHQIQIEQDYRVAINEYREAFRVAESLGLVKRLRGGIYAELK